MTLDFSWTRLPDGMLRLDYARGCQPAGFAEIALINEIESLEAELEATKRLVQAAYRYVEGEGDFSLIGAVEAHKRATGGSK